MERDCPKDRDIWRGMILKTETYGEEWSKGKTLMERDNPKDRDIWRGTSAKTQTYEEEDIGRLGQRPGSNYKSGNDRFT